MGTLQVIAKDVKLQLEFNPDVVQRYRLVGYENRLLAAEDFEDDTKDAGEIGAGHTVTAFYELDLADDPADDAKVATMRVRYKQPEGTTSSECSQELTLTEAKPTFEGASADFRFAAAVAEYAEILRHSKHSESARFGDILEIVRHMAGESAERIEFIELVESAQSLWTQD
jgi:Ca-activated chloride channel family protein